MTGFAQRAAGGRPLLEAAVVACLAALAATVAALAAVWPVEVLLAAAIATVVGILLLKLELAILVLVASAPLELAITYGANTQFTVTKLAGTICFASFVLNSILTRRKLVFDRTQAVVVGILAIAALSATQARESGPALATTTRYASFVALFFIVSQLVGEHTLQTRMAWVLSLASSVAGGLAVSNFLSGETLLADLPNGNSNDIAFILATTLPLTLWLLGRRGPQQAIVIAMLATISVSILLTLSRGALLGLAAGAVWTVFVERRHARAVFAATAVAAGAIALVLAFNSAGVERGLKAKEKVAQQNITTRLDAWNKAATFAVDHPLLGIGPGNFQNRYVDAVDSPPGFPLAGVVHNAYLDVAAELGIGAVVLLLLYLVMSFRRLTTAVRGGFGPPGFAGAVRTSLIVASVSAFTLSEQYFAPLWLLGGLAVALSAERRLAAAAHIR